MKFLSVKAITAIVVSLCMALAGVANAAEFEVSYLDGSSWNSIYAQGFSPSVSPNPNLGLGAGDTVSLTEFSFFRGDNSFEVASDIKLAIITPFYANLAGFNTGSSFLVGLSSNTVSGTAGINSGDAITFTFNNLPLTYGNGYGAVYVTENAGVLTPITVPSIIVDYVESPPGSGTYLPESDYGNGSYDFAVSNFINTGIFGSFFSAFAQPADANFVATFTAVPEPSSALLGLGCVALAVLGRARRV
jgi:hypothetical protein